MVNLRDLLAKLIADSGKNKSQPALGRLSWA